MKAGDKKNFINIANSVGELVQEKNIAYGDSFAKSQEIVKTLYPNGVQPEQYMDMLAITRVIDKLFRIATKKDAFGESPWRDICGYAVLGIANDEKGNDEGEVAISLKAEVQEKAEKTEVLSLAEIHHDLKSISNILDNLKPIDETNAEGHKNKDKIKQEHKQDWHRDE